MPRSITRSSTCRSTCRGYAPRASGPPEPPAPPPPAPPDSGRPPRGAPLPVAAAAAAVRSQERALTLVHRGLFAPSFEVGVEAQDPSGPGRGLLPTFGIALPLPLFNRSGGEA